MHSDTNEKDLFELLGLRSTQYFKQNFLINMLFINKSRKSKGFVFIVTPEKAHQALLKLNETDLHGGKILINEVISIRKKGPKHVNQNRRPNLNYFQENQDLFKQFRFLPCNKLYATAVSVREVHSLYQKSKFSRQTQIKRSFTIGDSHFTRTKKDTSRKNFKGNMEYFKYSNETNTR